jgi:hypothetical protein
VIAIEEIRNKDGYKVILDKIEQMRQNSLSVDWLIANYGRLNFKEVGKLPTAGLITADILKVLITEINDSEIRNKSRKEN